VGSNLLPAGVRLRFKVLKEATWALIRGAQWCKRGLKPAYLPVDYSIRYA